MEHQVWIVAHTTCNYALSHLHNQLPLPLRLLKPILELVWYMRLIRVTAKRWSTSS